VRILAVAQILDLVQTEFQRLRKGGPGLAAGGCRFEIVTDGGVIAAGAGEGGRRPALTHGQGGAARQLVELTEEIRILLRTGQYGDAGIVFGGGANHARSADIDILQSFCP